jgi:cation:H+ antiporter
MGNELILQVLAFTAGLALLVFGGEALVRGAVRLAALTGLSAVVIGLTVVAFGTSAPELAVSLAAAVSGSPEIAIGNVVGSNIFNVLVVLGIAAVIIPLPVASTLVRIDVPILIAVSVAFIALAANGILGRIEGAILLGAVVAYTIFAVYISRRESAVVERQASEFLGTGEQRIWVQALLIAVGLLLLVAGARLMVYAAVQIATGLGISQAVIGLTIVAAGTSLPEIATSVVAALRREPDIAVGNIVGSSIFNLLAIVGLTALVHPITVAPVFLQRDLWVMLAVTVAMLPIIVTGRKVVRWEGVLLLAGYAGYLYWVLAR